MCAAPWAVDRHSWFSGEEFQVRNRFLTTAVLAVALAALSSLPAAADLRIHIDKSSQTMTVAVDGWVQYQWPVSTAKGGYYTPNGSFRPFRLEPVWYSRKYDNAPMPNAIFFTGGYA